MNDTTDDLLQQINDKLDNINYHLDAIVFSLAKLRSAHRAGQTIEVPEIEVPSTRDSGTWGE